MKPVLAWSGADIDLQCVVAGQLTARVEIRRGGGVSRGSFARSHLKWILFTAEDMRRKREKKGRSRAENMSAMQGEAGMLKRFSTGEFSS